MQVMWPLLPVSSLYSCGEPSQHCHPRRSDTQNLKKDNDITLHDDCRVIDALAKMSALTTILPS
jgi:hypothetical protein